MTGLNLNGFTGSNYPDSLKGLRMMGSAVIALNGGYASGFVYNNTGTVQDSYSNILIYANRATGFVYSNSGNINNVYTCI